MRKLNRIDKRLALLNDGFTEIPGYPGYWAREDGVIASSINRRVDCYKVFKPVLSNRYYGANLYGGVNRFYISFHRLIAITFIPNPENKPQVNHKDGNKLNNNAGNLEWVTAIENSRHARRTGLVPAAKGIENGQAKLTEQAVREIHQAYCEGISIAELSAKYDVTEATIRMIGLGVNWKHLNLKRTLRTHLRGEHHPHTRFKESDILEMRAMYADGVKKKDIVIKFGCGRTTVDDILARNSWTHI